MSTPTKLSMYKLDPADPTKKEKSATFTLKGDEVEMEFFGNNPEYKRKMLLLNGLYDMKDGRKVFPSDGARFMELLPTAFPRASFIEIRDES